MHRVNLIIHVSPIRPSIIAYTLNLPLEPLNATRLISNTLPECTHGISKNIHLLSQVIESHIKVISQVDGVVIVHPFRCGFGSVRSAGNMDTHAVHSLFSQLLLALQFTCQASHQCSQ